MAWAGTTYHVLSTWESGEVVELGIQTPSGTHTARVWVLESEGALVLLYDAEPEVAEALMRGNPINMERRGHVSLMRPVARRMDDLPEDEVNRVFQLMDEKYGYRNRATDVFYRFLGRERNRVVMIVQLEE